MERQLVDQALPGYEISDEIGRGGWGVVLRGEHRTLHRKVAVKQLPRAFGADPEVRQRFLGEARVVASLEHPHIVPVYDFVELDGVCLIVMELLTGGTLWDRFEQGPMPVVDACSVALGVLSALDHAHGRGVLHRDVKPDNVLFNETGVPKLVDFGIAKVLGEASELRTATGVIMGTPAYMAPEQGTGGEVGPATDVYAVGVVLYELLGGRLPFESTGNSMAQLYRHVHEPPPPLAQVAPAVPAPIADAVMQALAKDPVDRHGGTAAGFVQALTAAADAALGPGWLTASAVPVLGLARLDTGARRAVSAEPPAGSPPTIVTPAPGSAAPVTGQPSEAGAPPAIAPGSAPSGVAHPSTPGSTPPPVRAAGAVPTSGPVPPPPATPTPVATPPSSTQGQGRILAVVAVVVAVVVVAIGAMILLGGGDGDDAAAPDEVPQSAISRFRTACRTNGVSDELCQCALDASLAELSVEEFLANDELLRAGTGELTAAVSTRFDRCLAE